MRVPLPTSWPVPRRLAHLLRDAAYAGKDGNGGFAPGFRRLLSGPMPERPAVRRLFRAVRRDREDLLRFVTRRDVSHANAAWPPGVAESSKRLFCTN